MKTESQLAEKIEACRRAMVDAANSGDYEAYIYAEDLLLGAEQDMYELTA